MPRFSVNLTGVVSVTTAIDAPTAEDAVEQAYVAGMPSLNTRDTRPARWSRELEEDGWEVTSVEDAHGNTVWKAGQE